MELTIITLTFSVLFSILFFMVGALSVWVLRDYIKRRIDARLSMHPEMYDEEGNLLTEGLIAFNFDNYDEFPTESEET
jgi:hypothetical protein